MFRCIYSQRKAYTVHNSFKRTKKLEGKNHFEELGVKRDIIKMYLKQSECEGVDWINLVQDMVSSIAFATVS